MACRYSYLRRFPQRTTDYDIALLRLSEQVDLTTYTPVCLPRAGADHTGETAWMVGWGVTSYGGTGSNKLLEQSLLLPGLNQSHQNRQVII